MEDYESDESVLRTNSLNHEAEPHKNQASLGLLPKIKKESDSILNYKDQSFLPYQ